MDNLPRGQTPGARFLRQLIEQRHDLDDPLHVPLLQDLADWPGRWTSAVLDAIALQLDLALTALRPNEDGAGPEAQLGKLLGGEDFFAGLASLRAVAQLGQSGIPVRLAAHVWRDARRFFATSNRGEVEIEVTQLAEVQASEWGMLQMAETWRGLSGRARESLKGATLVFHVASALWNPPGTNRVVCLLTPEHREASMRALIAELERLALAGGPAQTLFCGPEGARVEAGIHVPPVGELAPKFGEERRGAPLAVAVTRDGSDAPARLLVTGIPSEVGLGSYCRHARGSLAIHIVDTTWMDSRARDLRCGDGPNSGPCAVVATAFPLAGLPAASEGTAPLALVPFVIPGPYCAGEVPMDVLEALSTPLSLDPSGDLRGAAQPRRAIRFPSSRPPPALPRDAYWDGDFREAERPQEGPKAIHRRSPADWSDDLGPFPLGYVAPTPLASSWARVPAAERFACLRRLRDRLAARRGDFIEAITRSLGSPAWEARWEADMLPAAIDLALPQIERALADPPSVAAHREWCLHPAGSLAIEPPPVHFAHWLNVHAVSALALGHAVRAYSSPLAPWLGSLYALAVHEAGLPAGAFTLQHTAPSSTAGSRECDDGYAASGPSRAELLQISHEGQALFWEPTGWNPAFVLEDADLEVAARGLIEGALLSAGQRATTTSHCVVAGDPGGSWRLRLEARLVELATRIHVGHPDDPAAFYGPLLSRKAWDRFTVGDEGSEDDDLLWGDEPPLRADGRLGYYATPAIRRHPHAPAPSLQGLAPATLRLHALEARPRSGGARGGERLLEADDAVVALTGRSHARAVSIFTADRERFDRLAARLDVPAVLWNLPTTRAGELMPRFPILPWAPGGPYHRRDILKPGGEAKGTPKPEIPWPEVGAPR